MNGLWGALLIVVVTSGVVLVGLTTIMGIVEGLDERGFSLHLTEKIDRYVDWVAKKVAGR